MESAPKSSTTATTSGPEQIQLVMSLKAVEDTQDVDRAYAQLRERLLQAAQENAQIEHFGKDQCWLLGARGKRPCEAFWFSEQGFWIALQDGDPETYHVSFGNSNPAESKDTDGKPLLRPLFEGNFRRRGNTRQAEGAFGKGGTDQLIYVHSGKIQRAPAFARLYNGPQARLTWGRGQTDTRFAIGNLADANFLSDLVSFVLAVIEFIAGGSDPRTTEAFYRSTLRVGVLSEIQSLVMAGAKPDGSNVSSVRLRRLRDLSGWLRDDANLLDPTLDMFAEDRKREQRNARIRSIVGAAITLILGFLASAFNLANQFMQLLHTLGLFK